MKNIQRPTEARGFTMIEVLTVVVILSVLVSLMFPAYRNMKMAAQSAQSIFNLRQITTATIRWSAENADKLPSPIYPGGEPDDPDTLPEYWDYQETGTGLWLDGVVYAAVYVERDGDDASEEEAATNNKYTGTLTGGHIQGSFFESVRSVHVSDGQVTDYYKHSYAMNANLAYDLIHDDLGTSDPYLTEKSRSKLVHSPQALLFIDCAESNVVMASDLSLIKDTIEERWNDKYAICAFLDGHVAQYKKGEIPDGEPKTNLEASRFWRGVDPEGFER